ncbi:hypothetical protein CYY_001462 [Polysphondylium violaceum]|uniref:Calcium uniporter protein n=1 Tax=Polysphondylium violaceum TaxID=133409 RepID=A0A8J4PY54_9MYCE|nr:hypothetical protein CYY_001462 [Polysphondylium violaceum]
MNVLYRGTLRMATMPFNVSRVGASQTGFLSSNKKMFSTNQNLSNELQTILKQGKVVKLQERLNLDPRNKIPVTEFKSICTEFGIPENEVQSLSSALSQTGSIIYLPTSSSKDLQSTVFIKPGHIYQSLYHILDLENKGVGLDKLIEAKKNEIATLKQTIKPLEEKKQIIDAKAHRRATIIIYSGLGYCFIQAAALGRLTWWDLSWDIIEPVSYFLTFATVLIGYTYFTITKTEFSYEALNNRLFTKRQSKLMKKYDFPLEEYTRIKNLIEKREKEVEGLESAANYSSADLEFNFNK